MTSNTEPSGEVFADTDGEMYSAINAFNDNDVEKNIWMTQNLTAGYIGYDFKTNVVVKLVLLRNRNSSSNIFPVKTFKIQGSNGDDWEDLTGTITNSNLGQNATTTYAINNNKAYKKYRLVVLSATTYAEINKLQFYGREVF